MFGLFKKKEIKKTAKPKLVRFEVDELYTVVVPEDFEFYESDRFRLASRDDNYLMSIGNFVTDDDLGIVDEKHMETYVPMFQNYIAEGGFEPVSDLIIHEDFITQAFNVEDETQYYLTTIKRLKGKWTAINMVLRSMKTSKAPIDFDDPGYVILLRSFHSIDMFS